MSTCPSCGFDQHKAAARFCASCGGPLAAATTPPGLPPIQKMAGGPRRTSNGGVIAVIVLAALAVGGIAYASTRDDSDDSSGTTDVEFEDSNFDESGDLYLEDLWDECDAGDFDSCYELYASSPSGTTFEEFGATCGDRHVDWECGGAYLEDDYDDETYYVDSYGDDAYLDELWDECDTGDYDSCAMLFTDSPPGSRYEEFGATCGDRDLNWECP